MGKEGVEGQVDLPPGFRFFPTDEELVVHYLSNKVLSHPLPAFIIGEVDLYKYDPWQLPEKALFGEKEWYFFTPRDRKYPNGSRPNRAAGSGYWKATGADKPITACGGKKRVGVKKALVFYKGKAPKGSKTNWIMHEYRLAEINMAARRKDTLRLDDWVLCRIYNKKSSAEKLAEKKLMEATSSDKEEMNCGPDMEDQKEGGIIMKSVHSEPSPDASTGCAAVASSSTNCDLSSLPVNFGSDYHNPFYQQTQISSNIPPMTTTAPPPPPPPPPPQLNNNSITAKTNYVSSQLNKPCDIPYLVAPEKGEVQSSYKLGNFYPKQQQTHAHGFPAQSLLNFSFSVDGIQSPNFLQFDQTEASFKNPYQDYIDSLYNLQRSHQGSSDVTLH